MPASAPASAGADAQPQDAPLFSLQEPLRWRCLDGEWLVFGTSSGALLRPDPLGAAILALLDESPLSLEAIVQRIASDTETAITPALRERVDGIVEALRRADLLRCLAP